MLAEAISSKKDRGDIAGFFNKRSVLKLPVAASWLVAPVYGCTRALHHALEKEADADDSDIFKNVHGGVSQFLNNMESYYLHPRVLAARRSQNPFN